MESDVHSDDRDTLYLSSCRVHLSGFETAEENRLVSMLFDGGATRFVEFNDTVTHLILGQPAERLVDCCREISVAFHFASRLV